jgi:hypothetical protein
MGPFAGYQEVGNRTTSLEDAQVVATGCGTEQTGRCFRYATATIRVLLPGHQTSNGELSIGNIVFLASHTSSPLFS